MEEIWKDMPGLSIKHQCSNFGRIRKINKDKRCLPYRYLKLQEYNSGYLMANPSKEYRKLVHRIVAELFIPNPLKLPCVNHKDFNKKNNIADNLEWCTQKENVRYSRDNGRMGRYRYLMKDISTGIIYNSLVEAANVFGIGSTYLAKQIRIHGIHKNLIIYEKCKKNYEKSRINP